MKRLWIVAIGFLLFLTGCGQSEAKEATEWFTYTKYTLPLENKVSLGEGAEHEIIFVFDYSCPWCKKWMNEILPEIETKWVETGDAVYKGQPLVLLNEQSQFLANVDYNVEQVAPDLYYEIQRHIGHDAGEADDFGTEAYIRKLAAGYSLDADRLLKKSGTDSGIQNARLYTRDLGVEYVPTVYVDGIKVLDAFDIEEIERVLNGNIEVGDQVPMPNE